MNKVQVHEVAVNLSTACMHVGHSNFMDDS